MIFFKSRAEKELDGIMASIRMNMANNYKDNAREDLERLETVLEEMKAAGKVKPDVLSKYGTILEDYKMQMKGYSHKDQKPYWNSR